MHGHARQLNYIDRGNTQVGKLAVKEKTTGYVQSVYVIWVADAETDPQWGAV